MKDLGLRTNNLFTLIVKRSFLIAAFFAIVGVVLVFWGARGQSRIELFGNSASCENVGVACLFIAAIVICIIIKRVLTSHDVVINSKQQHISGNNGNVKVVDESQVLNLHEGKAEVLLKKHIQSMLNEIDHYKMNKIADRVAVKNISKSIKKSIKAIDDSLGNNNEIQVLNDLAIELGRVQKNGFPDEQILNFVQNKLSDTLQAIDSEG